MQATTHSSHVTQSSNAESTSRDVASSGSPWLAISAPASLFVVVGLVIYLAKLSF